MRYRDILCETQIVNMVDALQQYVRYFNPPDSSIRQWLTKKLTRFFATDYRGPALMRLYLRRDSTFPDWAMKLIRANQPVYRINPFEDDTLRETIRNILDWFRHLERNNPAMFARIDRISFQQADQAQQAWHQALLKKASSVEIGEEEGAVTVLELPNGYRWVELTDEACLDTEGRRMGHCVGDYGADVHSGSTMIYSLRDAKNIPHVTVEVSRRLARRTPDHHDIPAANSIDQVKGRGNQPPIDKYIPMVLQLARALKLTWYSGGKRDIEQDGLGFR